MRLIIYLGNMLVMCDLLEELTRQVNMIQELFKVLGLTISKKSQLTSVQEIVCLGHQLSTTQMKVSLPQSKMQKIRQGLQNIMKKPSVSV